MKESQWALTNGLFGGRNDERDRDRSGIWDTLGPAVGKVWPGLRDWIMRSAPYTNGDDTWFKMVKRIDPDEAG